MTIGKVFVIQKEFESALDAFNTSMAIKKELFRSKSHKEIRELEMLISGVCEIGGLSKERPEK